MLELIAISTDVAGCFGRPAALDALAGPAELAIRVAPTELLLIGDRRRAADLELELRALDPGGLALDLTGAYTLWSLRGDSRHEAFARLSAIPLPAPGAIALGLVGHVPAKVVVRDDELMIVISSVVSHHLRDRLHAACADLRPHEPVSAEGPAEKAAAR